jgi:carboxymethylenebutenolidase
MKEKITYRRPDGKEGNAYCAVPAGGETTPGVVVLQEWRGLNDYIKGVADRHAAVGYRALVPDLYRGKVTLEAAEAKHLTSNLDFGDAATQDIRGAVKYLKGTSPMVAVIGFCMGGVLAILAAVYAKETDAAAIWYGVPPAEAADTRTIKIPVQGHFALEDEHFTPVQVDARASRLKEGKVNCEFYRYQAQHGFGNETGERHGPAATKLARQRTLDFPARHIK